jgi:hypothetical protein
MNALIDAALFPPFPKCATASFLQELNAAAEMGTKKSGTSDGFLVRNMYTHFGQPQLSAQGDFTTNGAAKGIARQLILRPP